MKNSVCQIFRALVRHRDKKILALLEKHPATVRNLVNFYGDPDGGLHVGVMLRECAVSPLLNRVSAHAVAHIMQGLTVTHFCPMPLVLRQHLLYAPAATHGEGSSSSMSPVLKTLFQKYLGDENFEVSLDAFATLQSLLSAHKEIGAEFLKENYDEVRRCSLYVPAFLPYSPFLSAAYSFSPCTRSY